MKRSFIADASVAIAWVHPAQATPETDAMLDRLAAGDSLIVPALWPLEVANALTVLRRRRKLTPDEARTAIEIIRELPAVIDHEAASVAFTRLVDLASEHELTVYDATYIELATRRQLPLASNDVRMKQAAVRSGVDLWQRDESGK
ncbi:MAG TPA: type II toxin-antitoxin system VapC family toxin [Thermoanaerobaculia bacterium]|nr:type II toxin-antitoxin system VapC family toxin [Thermoanaerobaculia bacterium]